MYLMGARITLGEWTVWRNMSRPIKKYREYPALSKGWLGSRVISVLDSGGEGPGSNRSRDAVG